ncbi:ATP-binding protein [Desulfohalovibrio reitneri]|uniref:ATP-binding protein n=1 Tax=Desulfohalovibrio reitneri TaxID=1307759 RepID=UPI0006915EF1|nr:ATP-binding protein [Desulfohalovibrio reitneri]
MFASVYPSGVSRRLVFRTLVFGVLIFLMVTGGRMLLAYRQAVEEVRQDLEQIGETRLDAVAEAVWLANDPLLRAQVEGLLHMPYVSSAVVREQGEVVLELGSTPQGESLSRTFRLVVRVEGTPRDLGSLAVTADLGGVRQAMLNRTRASLLADFLAVAVIAGFVLLLFQYLVNRHLAEVAGYLRQSDLGGTTSPLLLNRPPNPPDMRDELDELVDALNDASARLRESRRRLRRELEGRRRAEAELKAARDELERRVESRTAELTLAVRELGQSQELLQTILDNSPALLFMRDLRGRYVFVNSRLEEYFGFSSAQAEGKLPRDVLPGELAETAEAAHNEAVRTGRQQTVEAPFELHSRKRLLLLSYFPIKDERGRVTSVCGIGQDITDRAEMERLAIRAKEDAEAASRAKSEFLANMSHEIRTPLNGVLGMLELLDTDELSREQREYVRTARFSARSLLTIIGDILDFSKIEAGRLEIESSPFSPAEVARKTAATFEPRIEAKGLDLRVEIDPGAEGVARGDAGRLRQVLFNLLGNAVKFTERGEVRLAVSSLPSAPDGGRRLLFEVSDTGIGIREEKLGRIFEPFTQAEGSMSRRFEGTGLGLGIVKRLVQLMGGSVSVDSEVGKGTSVYFSLTLDRYSGTAPGASKAREGVEPSGLTLLLAEDNPINRLAVSRQLEQRGHTALTASNGLEALDVLRGGERVDAVFLDIQMPELDGLETARRIRSSGEPWADVPLIALTAHAMNEDRDQALGAGMDGYLAKPVDTDEMQAELARVLSGESG